MPTEEFVSANQRLLRDCKNHDFDFEAKTDAGQCKCKNCGGQVPWDCAAWYMLGVAHGKYPRPKAINE